MEVSFDVYGATAALVVEDVGISVGKVTAKTLKAVPSSRTPWGAVGRSRSESRGLGDLLAVVDAMGNASAKAQGLGAVITTSEKMLRAPDHRLYVAISSDCRAVLGIIKVGVKHLFIRNDRGMMKELDPLCVLDFYVHESCQRRGIGKVLFEFMIQQEGVVPCRLAFDRPSKKFLSFLSKYYGLRDYTPQVNNFVLYKQYFDWSGRSSGGGGGGGGGGDGDRSGGAGSGTRRGSRDGGPIASVSSRPLTAQKSRSFRGRPRGGGGPGSSEPEWGTGSGYGVGGSGGSGGSGSGSGYGSAAPPVAAMGRSGSFGRPAAVATSAGPSYGYPDRVVDPPAGSTGHRTPPAHAAARDAVRASYGGSTPHVSEPSHVPGLGGGAPSSRPYSYSRTTLSRPF